MPRTTVLEQRALAGVQAARHRAGGHQIRADCVSHSKPEVAMNEQPKKARYGVDSYLEWVAAEGVPVVEDYGIYLFDVETKMWPRYGMKGAACHCTGRGDL